MNYSPYLAFVCHLGVLFFRLNIPYFLLQVNCDKEFYSVDCFVETLYCYDSSTSLQTTV